MKVKELLGEWEQATRSAAREHEFEIRLTIHEAAKVAALKEMYPGLTQEDVIHDLIAAALADLEAIMPYVQGQNVVGEDELGDPIYEDVGPTPRFIELSRQHLKRLQAARSEEV